MSGARAGISHMLACAIRPLRHLIPLHWRTGIKIWIRDHPRRRSGLNRILTWFVGSAPTQISGGGEENLPPVAAEDWRDNPQCPSPLVSVIIPCHNYGSFLQEALKSVLSQTFQNFEIIVVDDGSDDPETREILAQIEEPRIRVIHQENRGQALSRTRGITEAKGRWICCLDADDMLQPTHLEKHLFALEARQCDEAHGDLERFGDGEGVARFGEFDLATLLDHCSVNTTAVFRRDAWSRTDGHSDAMRAGFCDWNFWIDLAATGARGFHLREPLHLWRRHGTSITSGSTRRQRELLRRIRDLHRDLIDHPDRVAEISAGHRRTRAREPFVNMTPDRFLPPDEGVQRTLLAIPSLSPSTISDRIIEAAQALRRSGRRELLVLICDELRVDADVTPLQRLTHAGIPHWHIQPMIPIEFIDEFPARLTLCHRVSTVITAESALSPAARETLSRELGFTSREVSLPFSPSEILAALGLSGERPHSPS